MVEILMALSLYSGTQVVFVQFVITVQNLYTDSALSNKIQSQTPRWQNSVELHRH